MIAWTAEPATTTFIVDNAGDVVDELQTAAKASTYIVMISFDLDG